MAARASRTRSVVAALALAAVLTSCATGAEVEDETVGASQTPSPSASPSPEPTTFTTQNGTASFALPSGWTVDDSSSLMQNFDGQLQWNNVVQVLDAGGATRASYSDGYGSDISGGGEEEVVQSLPMAGATTAVAWWSHDPESGAWRVDAAVVTDTEDPFHVVPSPVEGRFASFVADLSAAPECASILDEAAAVTCLESPSVTETLAVLASLELTDLPWDAMPEGVDPQTDVPWVEFASADGAIAFSYPASWPIVTHELGSGAEGDTFVTLVTPDGYQALDIRRSAWVPVPSRSDATKTDPYWTPMDVHSGEPIAPFVDPAMAPRSPLQLATFTFGGDGSDGTMGVATLRADHVALGCFDPRLPAADGSLEVSTPWGTDMEGLVYDRYPGGVGFVGSYEHDVMLAGAGSVVRG